MKKRIYSSILIAVILAAMLPTITTMAMTNQEGAEWALSKVGQRIDTDGQYGAQCVDLIVQYCKENFGWNPQGSGNAEAYRTVALPNSSWTRIQNTPEFVPQPGDIAIWNPTESNGNCGHVAIVISATVSSFVSVDQNWVNFSLTNGSAAAKVTHTYSGFWGVIRPPFTNVAPEPVAPTYSRCVKDGTYTIKNASSGYMMNVYGGNDTNGTKVTTWQYDGTVDQRFVISYAGSNMYYIKAACSSSGKVVDVYRGSSITDPINDGDVIDIYTANDAEAQLFYIAPLSGGTYAFELAKHRGYVISPTSSSAAATNGTQLQLKAWNEQAYQKWIFCNTSGSTTDATYSDVDYEPIHTSETATVSNGLYTIKNAASGYMMNVYAGRDANGTKVTTWEYDGTTDQQFRIAHQSDGRYLLYFNASSSGRTVDVLRGSSITDSIDEGDVIDIYDANDSEAQQFYIVPMSDGTYVFELASKNRHVIAAADAASAASNGVQLQLKKYTEDAHQKWYLCNTAGAVINHTVSRISINTPPSKTSYFTNGVLDTNGLTLNVSYNDNTSAIISSGYTVSYDFSTAGVKTVTVTYEGAAATFSVNVKKPAITGLSVSVYPISRNYYVGDSLDTTGLSLLATFEDGSAENILSGYTVSYDFSTSGTKLVTITCEGQSVTYDVTVEKAGSASILAKATQRASLGSEIVFTVELSEAENVFDGNFNVAYDNTVLKYKSGTVGSVLSGHSAMINPTYAEDLIRVTFTGTSELVSGSILSLVFEVISPSAGTVEIKIDKLNLYNAFGSALSMVEGNMSASSLINAATEQNASITVSGVSPFVITLHSSQPINGVVIAALYDEAGMLLETKSYPAQGTMSVELTAVAQAKSARFMWWSDMGCLSPICEAALKEL